MRRRRVARRAEDLGRAVAYCTDLPGAGPVAVSDPPGLASLDLDGTCPLLDTGAPSALLHLHVDDVREAVERLRVAPR